MLTRDSFYTFVIDNIDHNTFPFDDQNTCHIIAKIHGMIAFIINEKSPATKIQCHKVLDKEFLEKSHIFILKFSQKAAILKAIKFKTLEKNFNGDYLWILSYCLKNPTPVWSGCTQILHKNTVKDPVKKNDTVPLSFINLIFLSSFLSTQLFKGCVHYICVSLFFKSKQKYFSN